MQLTQEARNVLAELKASKADDLSLLELINVAIDSDRVDGRETGLSGTALTVMARIGRTNDLIEVITNG